MKKRTSVFFILFVGIWFYFLSNSYANAVTKKISIEEWNEFKSKIVIYTKRCPQLSQVINTALPRIDQYVSTINDEKLSEEQTLQQALNFFKQAEVDPNFIALEKLPLRRDDCSTYSVIARGLVYSMNKSQDKLKNLRDDVKKIENNNYILQTTLCGDFNLNHKVTNSQINERIYYCEAAVKNKNKPIFLTNKDFKSAKESLKNELPHLYFNAKKDKKLIRLCAIMKDNKSQENCGYYEQLLADDFYVSKQYGKAIALYEAAARYKKDSSYIRSTLGDMYLFGRGVPVNAYAAIRWYKEALRLNYSASLIGNIGASYYKLKDYRTAFQYYYLSAKKGDAWFQANLASMYANGTGVIQDYAEAYAWISLALTEGFNDKQKELGSKYLKNWLENNLRYSGELTNARALAKKYYNLYVLHKIYPVKNPSRTFHERLDSALNELTS